MNEQKRLEAEDCRNLTPRLFAVNHGAGETLAPAIADLLDPIEPGSCHYWALAKEKATKLHYHDFDEYWSWAGGRTRVTIRLPDGRADVIEVGPGWTIYCVRGVEHGHAPKGDWACFEWRSVSRPSARPGHLYR